VYNLDEDLYHEEDMFNIRIKEGYLDSGDLIRLDFDPLEPKTKFTGEELKISPQEAKIKGRCKEKF
jgi:hypothetical protein